MKNRYCASSLCFLYKQSPFPSKILKRCHFRVLCLVNFGGRKVAGLVFVSTQNAAEKEIFKLMFVLVLQ